MKGDRNSTVPGSADGLRLVLRVDAREYLWATKILNIDLKFKKHSKMDFVFVEP